LRIVDKVVGLRLSAVGQKARFTFQGI
jgi:hypothetical protein